MIPKVIHAIWLGGPKTGLARKCRASWSLFAPDYAVREWGNEEVAELGGAEGGAFPPYVREALAARKWAFASDYLRFLVLAREGGLYLDYDVELVRPLTEGLGALGLEGRAWCAREYLAHGGEGYSCAAMALEKGSPVAARMLAAYEGATFDARTTVGDRMALLGLRLAGAKPEWFCPFDARHHSLRTAETLGVHHYALSWISPQRRVARWLNWHGCGALVEALLALKRRCAR